MSSPKSSGTTTPPQSSTMSSPMSSGTTTPQQASTELQWANQPIGSSRVTVSVNPTAEAGTDTNFRPPVLPNGDNVIMYHYSPQYVPRQGPYFLANNGANYSPNLYGFGTTNVTNWLQGNPQRPPTRLTSPLNPSAHPDNGNPSYLHGFSCMANQQYGPSLRPRSDPINIYRPRGQALCTGHLGIPSAATSNSIIIIPDDSPPQTLSAAPSSPLRTSLLVPREEPEQDPTSQDEKPREQQEEEHKCLFCNKLFESGKALGGHMSSHEKKRKRERELTESVGKNFMAAASSSTADGAGTSSRPADGTEERDELEATDVEDEAGRNETESKRSMD